MGKRLPLAMFSIWLLATAALVATPGNFRGVVVEGPKAKQVQGWIFVQGKNGMLRRVEIAQANIHYDESFPESKRQVTPRTALKPGIEVRVTANQGKDGEWHATEIEIMEPDADTNLPADRTPLTESRIT